MSKTNGAKPCPWCGDSPYLNEGEHQSFLCCGNCGGGPYADGPAAALAAWNTRPIEDALLAFARAYVALFRDSDMSPEDECHELFAQASEAITKATGELA